jgi:ribosomal-protein-alanine N-acetyltransferase
VLRKFTPESFDKIYGTLDEAEQMEVLGLKSVDELAVERKKYADGLSTYNKKFAYFQLLDRGSKEIMGWCGYHTWYVDHNRAELGYGLFKDERKRKGYMMEALAPIIEYGFVKMHLNRIEAFVGDNNVASLRVLQKQGFKPAGVMREHHRAKEKPEDSLVFSLLKSAME